MNKYVEKLIKKWYENEVYYNKKGFTDGRVLYVSKKLLGFTAKDLKYLIYEKRYYLSCLEKNLFDVCIRNKNHLRYFLRNLNIEYEIKN